MPATWTHPRPAHMRGPRLLAAALTLLFLGTIAAAWSTPVEAKDWTPQIAATRRSQIYWESLMRAADADVRFLKKATRQAQRKIKTTERNRSKANARRSLVRHRLAQTRTELHGARASLAASTVEVPPPPDAATAVLALQDPDFDTPSVVPAVAALVRPEMGYLGQGARSLFVTRADLAVTVADVKLLDKQANKQKRSFQKAKQRARHVSRNVRAAHRRLAAIKSAERSAIARRESAERSLGAWIIAMSKYGRIRATKKSDVRPGVNSSFVWPARGSLSQGYHAGHDGLDIVSYRGAPIRASAYGVVTFVGWNPWDQHGRAFMVVVTHAGGYETLYGHMLPTRRVRVGQEVAKGEVIGYMGSTGNSTGTHVHFELRRGRTTVNPLPFL